MHGLTPSMRNDLHHPVASSIIISDDGGFVNSFSCRIARRMLEISPRRPHPPYGAAGDINITLEPRSPPRGGREGGLNSDDANGRNEKGTWLYSTGHTVAAQPQRETMNSARCATVCPQ
jgi:hypothetical protein